MRWFKIKRRGKAVEEVIGPQISFAVSRGVRDPFQSGFGHALCWSWEQAGLPPTAESIALQAMVEASIIYGAWRTMGSAPKDGSRILLTNGSLVATGAWREEYNGAYGKHEWRWSVDGELGGECPWANDYMGEPRAWQPLPDATLPADMVLQHE